MGIKKEQKRKVDNVNIQMGTKFNICIVSPHSGE
jgi:hypothetical protein